MRARTLDRARPDEDASLRRLCAAEIVSGAGDGVFWVGLIAMLSPHAHLGVLLTLAVVARLGPRALLSIAAGSVVDRSRLPALLVAVDVVRACVMTVLAVMVAMDVAPVAVLAVVLLSYVVGVPTRPGVSALLPHVVDVTRLAPANAILSTIRQIMTFIGPLIGVAVTAWSIPGAFAFNGLSFAASAVLVAGIANRGRRSTATMRRQRGPNGIDVVRAIPGLGTLIGLIGAMYFARGAEMVLYVLLVRDLLGAEPAMIGYLGGAVGIGAVLATPLARRAANAPTPVGPMLVSVFATGIPTAALAFSEDLLITCLLLVIVGAGIVVFEVTTVITVQRVTPVATMGRSFGVVNTVSNGGKLAGAVIAPLLAAVFAVTGALIAVGALLVAAGTITVRQVSRLGRLAAIRRATLEPMVAVLVDLPLFAGAPRASLERIAGDIVVLTVEPDTVLIREHDPADHLFIARSGAFRVTVGGELVNTMGPDDWFGEIGLVDRVPRTATVEAASPAIVWSIPGDAFIAALEDTGAPSDALLVGIADRLASGSADTR